MTLALGLPLFDSRYGLARHRPLRLAEMPQFDNDEIVPTRAGGDVLLQICAGQRDTVVHTARELMRYIAGKLTVRWTIDGFRSANRGPYPNSNPRAWSSSPSTRTPSASSPPSSAGCPPSRWSTTSPPFGGGYFFAPPGPKALGDFVGSGLSRA